MSESGLLLAIESATARASVALLQGVHVLVRRDDRTGQHHSETLLPMLDALLADVGAELADVDAFAVSIGPGAFTSLRIGLATVKGLAFDSDRPVVAVSTLEALAATALAGEPADADAPAIAATLDARRGEVYAAAWAPDRLGPDFPAPDARAPLLEPGVYTPANLVERLPPGARLVGEGVSILADWPGASEVLSLEGRPHTVPDAVAVGLIGARDLEAGQGVSAADLIPRYLRATQAEEQRARDTGAGAPGSSRPL